MTAETRPADPFGLALIGKALAMIWAHAALLLVVFLPLYAVWTWAILALANSAVSIEGLPAGGVSGLIFRIVAIQVLVIVGGAVLAVMWHRAALASESIVPPPGRVLGYLGWTFLIWLVMILISLVPGLLSASLFQVLGPDALFALRVLAMAVNLVFAYAMLRIGLVLPASSVGDREMDMIGSILATGERGLGLWVAAFLQVVVLGLLGWAGLMVYQVSAVLAQAAGHVLTALSLLFGLAILTALYDDHLSFGADAPA